MFTGIIETTGKIAAIAPCRAGYRAAIASPLDLRDSKVGDSIAVNGVCLTVVAIEQNVFSVDVSAETISCTSGFRQDDSVNLEKALRASDRLGGHWVSGHVDGVGDVAEFEPAGDNALLRIAAPHALMKYIARKGSITVNGVSLTVNAVNADSFSINLIPQTLQATNLHALRRGSKVNLEIDMLARYVERLAQFGAVSISTAQ
ncbi:MAG: riboflavin synthase [Burkholderiales bacterium]|nr:riboflavin synthase [Burkholderiales bacterium]MDQ3195159.1 riboflavin synthase [Pseudomonadota bacterium]